MTIKIGLIGGPGSGKSTQAAHFFSICKQEQINIELISEWTREAINKGQLPIDNPWAQFWIYEEQKKKEDCLPSAIQFMVTDSPTLLSYVYVLMNASRPKDNYLILKMYENFLIDLDRYDFIFICAREKEYLQDGTRYQTKKEALELDRLILSLLSQHKIPCSVISGSVEERTSTMRAVIGV